PNGCAGARCDRNDRDDPAQSQHRSRRDDRRGSIGRGRRTRSCHRCWRAGARHRGCTGKGKAAMTSSPTSVLPAGSEADLHIPFTDLSIQWRQIEEKALPDICRLFENSAFCLGPFVKPFDQPAPPYLMCPHSIGVNSGASALHLALIAVGIGPGAKVLVLSYTFVATAWGVLYVGATPVLCDIEEESANIDLANAEERLDAAVKAIIPVHLYGQP